MTWGGKARLLLAQLSPDTIGTAGRTIKNIGRRSAGHLVCRIVSRADICETSD